MIILEHRSYERIGEEIYRGVLENGLRYVLVPKKEYTKSYAFFAANYGGVNRRFYNRGQWLDSPMGVAHFLEHKMFDMPDGTSALNVLAERGASPNAFTSDDMTAYHFSCSSKFYENLDTLLTFVSTPYFTEESVEKERGIIGQEIGMVEDSPGHRLYYDLLACLYKNHPIRDSVAGTVESIADITPDILYVCHRIFYNPSNMVLCAVGDIDPDKVAHAADRILTRERILTPQTDYGEAEPKLPAKHRSERRMAVSRPQFAIGAKAECRPFGTELQRTCIIGELAVRLLCGESSPLYARLYGQGKISKSFEAEFSATAKVAFAAYSGDSDDPEEVYEAIIAEAAHIASNGADEALFERIRKAYIGALLREYNSFDRICYNGARGCFGSYDVFDVMRVLDSITCEDACRFIADGFTHEKTAIAIISPSN